MTVLHNIRHVALGMFIALALTLPCCPAHAQDRAELVVAGGCFWCVEADFESLPGVIEAVSGFTGGSVANPSYKQVTGGNTGHYEAVRITYDPSKVSQGTLLRAFFRSVDPTDAGGQFCDRGDSYRTAVFAGDAKTEAAAKRAIKTASADLGQAIATPVLPLTDFYPAEDYHQDFYKSDALIFTRFGPRKKSTAYKLYRESCGRDQRVRELWGDQAPFAGS